MLSQHRIRETDSKVATDVVNGADALACGVSQLTLVRTEVGRWQRPGMVRVPQKDGFDLKWSAGIRTGSRAVNIRAGWPANGNDAGFLEVRADPALFPITKAHRVRSIASADFFGARGLFLRFFSG